MADLSGWTRSRYIEVVDEYWRRNMLLASFWCWSPIRAFCRQHKNFVINNHCGRSPITYQSKKLNVHLFLYIISWICMILAVADSHDDVYIFWHFQGDRKLPYFAATDKVALESLWFRHFSNMTLLYNSDDRFNMEHVPSVLDQILYFPFKYSHGTQVFLICLIRFCTVRSNCF